MSSPSCGKINSCKSFFAQNPFDTTITTANEWIYTIVQGYNKFIFDQPLYVYKGSFLYLTQTSGKIAIDTSNTIDYSDLVWQNTIYSKFNEFQNWRFYLNALNNYTFYLNQLNLIHTYSNIGIYNIIIRFTGSSYSLIHTVNVTDSKSLFIELCFQLNNDFNLL